ncbi:biofilm peroxide resistance protein BsmA [Erwinia mallotivora]|uniref:Biofilm stress and motility protein A n=1 Tax=Erwinia mallotivora TaxID=69222 RepID=A0A014NKJ6_9GAMM|nr:biofilm peroxide resistance protein BsmA [Erwinia mallotivora]EXU74285.1 biofilm stress and motility protein A [Erwinia mallotivora]
MQRLLLLLAMLLMSGCSLFTVTPQSPPAATAKAQEINRAQSLNLRRTGTISVSVRGSPDDALRAIADKATAAGASWYQVQLVSETIMPGYWYATAILYAPAVVTRSTHHQSLTEDRPYRTDTGER